MGSAGVNDSPVKEWFVVRSAAGLFLFSFQCYFAAISAMFPSLFHPMYHAFKIYMYIYIFIKNSPCTTTPYITPLKPYLTSLYNPYITPKQPLYHPSYNL